VTAGCGMTGLHELFGTTFLKERWKIRVFIIEILMDSLISAVMVKKSVKKTVQNKKFSFADELYSGILEIAETAKDGSVRLKKSDLKKTLEDAFEKAAHAAASGERVRFPIIGILARKDVAARKAGKGINRFTGEEIMVEARPASKKPRWSFPKALKDVFGNKKHW
jgi:nucleoid DNA-binding protein